MIGCTNRITRSELTLVALTLALGTAACASHGRPLDNGYQPTPDGRHFSAQMIRASGALTAWQVLERLALSMQPRLDGNGHPASIGRVRPAYRYNDPSTTLVVLNGFRIPDLRVLSEIPASEIAAMHVLRSTRAQILYGDEGWNGAIVVETFQRRR